MWRKEPGSRQPVFPGIVSRVPEGVQAWRARAGSRRAVPCHGVKGAAGGLQSKPRRCLMCLCYGNAWQGRHGSMFKGRYRVLSNFFFRFLLLVWAIRPYRGSPLPWSKAVCSPLSPCDAPTRQGAPLWDFRQGTRASPTPGFLIRLGEAATHPAESAGSKQNLQPSRGAAVLGQGKITSGTDGRNQAARGLGGSFSRSDGCPHRCQRNPR